MTDQRIIVCPGQGAQKTGMGRAWYDASPEARAVFDRADELLAGQLGEQLTTLCFHGPDDALNRTNISQPAIFVASVASWHALCSQWDAGDIEEANVIATAGLSLGEYTALHLAGAFTFEDGLRLVTLRGQAMQDAAESTPSGMVALIGADEAKAQAVCDEARGSGVLVCANFNATGQVVISGSQDACDRAVEVASEHGLRATSLSVAGAFHSPIMESAARRLQDALADTEIRPPRCTVLSNVTATQHEAGVDRTIEDTIRDRLVEQLTSPVRWADGCAALAQQTDGAWHELAPGKTLAGLMRRIDKAVKVETHDAPE